MNPYHEIAAVPLSAAFVFLVVAWYATEAPPLVRALLVLIAVPCLVIGVHFLKKEPERYKYVRVQPAPWSKDKDLIYDPWERSGKEAVPQAPGEGPLPLMGGPWDEPLGFGDKAFAEMSDIAAHYVPMDPADPFSLGEMSMRSSEEHHQVPTGGGWVIGGDSGEDPVGCRITDSPRHLLEGVHVIDQGGSFVIDMDDVQVPEEAIEVMVETGQMFVHLPVRPDLPGPVTRRPGKPDSRSIHVDFLEDVIPDRAWADLWSDRLRITVPKDRTHAYTSPEGTRARVILREGRSPPLPPVPLGEGFQPMIGELYVHDLEDHYEVVATLHKRVQREFKYTGESERLSLVCIAVRLKDGGPKSPVKRVVMRKRTYILGFPSPVDWSSTDHSIDGDALHIWLPKTGATRP